MYNILEDKKEKYKEVDGWMKILNMRLRPETSYELKKETHGHHSISDDEYSKQLQQLSRDGEKFNNG